MHIFENIIKEIIGTDEIEISLLDINIPAEFRTAWVESRNTARGLNSAFLIVLSGPSHPLFRDAVEYLNSHEHDPEWKDIVSFYNEGVKLIDSEISGLCNDDISFKDRIDQLSSWLSDKNNLKKQNDTNKKIRSVFFPEGISISDSRDEDINILREKRKVKISQLNSSPIKDPANEILFTSNVLITIPSVSKGIDGLDISSDLKKRLKRVVDEEQVYWYDHPIPVGVTPEHNEVLHGLEGLDSAVAFEKERGTIDRDAKLSCLLSVSVTHKGLQDVAKEYLQDALRNEKNITHLDIYVFTEADTRRLINEILEPAAERYLSDKNMEMLYDILGVNGEYARHYTFLKAVSAFWKVLIAPGIKGTFKIDLDQVFPQKELVEESGSSAFEHLMTPLWGATGKDSRGEEVELGMIAGALVNESDIENSLFTPDVRFPETEAKGEELIFFSALPQALSTEAEMMTRYRDDELDGKNGCIQRIHVTGGTNGILIDSLRRHRPFTPTFMGRAEDQAYTLSVLFHEYDRHLRYVHKDGLIMRHDKEAFAADAIKTSAIGKLIGDYIRILYFSYYCRALPWPVDKIKETIDPFTGCFVSKIPVTVVYLRFALKLASFFSEGKEAEGLEFLKTGARRLHKTIKWLEQKPNPLSKKYQDEKEGWNIYYDVLDAVEKNIADGDGFALELQNKAKALANDCRIKI